MPLRPPASGQRRRGPRPTRSGAEVLTTEAVGEFLGLDREQEMFDYFRRHYGHFFSRLLRKVLAHTLFAGPCRLPRLTRALRLPP